MNVSIVSEENEKIINDILEKGIINLKHQNPE